MQKPTEPTCPVCREAIAVFEAMRRLNHPADNIWFEYHGDVLFVILKDDDNKTVINVKIGGPMQGDLYKAAEWWNSTAVSPEDKDRLWRASGVYENSASFVTAMMAATAWTPKTKRKKVGADVSQPQAGASAVSEVDATAKATDEASDSPVQWSSKDIAQA